MGVEGLDVDVVMLGMEVMFGENCGDLIVFVYVVVDVGVDFVIGYGFYVLCGVEFYCGCFIVYSFGNFGGGGVFGVEEEICYGVYFLVIFCVDGIFVDGGLWFVCFDFVGGVLEFDFIGWVVEFMNEWGWWDFLIIVVIVDGDGLFILFLSCGG